MQSGGNIYTSMSSVCLENLEALSKKGVDMGVICNTVGNVYAGMSDTVRVVAASLSQSFLLLLDKLYTRELFPCNGSEYRCHENGSASPRQFLGR